MKGSRRESRAEPGQGDFGASGACARLSRRACLAGLGASAFLTPLLGAARDAAAATAFPPLFGTRAIECRDLASFPKWTGALARFVEECRRGRDPGTWNDEAVARWQAFLGSLREQPRMRQLERVNARMNRQDYVHDGRNYGVRDYWATPAQFLARSGDCEDFAIAKFLTLRALGWENRHLRLVVVQDMRAGEAHAILVAQLDGHAWALDNKRPLVTDVTRITHYRPYYSINETAWWLHH